MANNGMLADLREQIDDADNKLLDALAERMAIVKKVGIYKKEHDLPALSPERWQQVLEDKKQKATSMELSVDLVEELYQTLHKHALLLEEEIKNQ